MRPGLAKILELNRPAPPRPTTELIQTIKFIKRVLESCPIKRPLRPLPPAHTSKSAFYNGPIKMLDIFDFIVDKGGNPEKIKESQRRRYAPVEAVDEVIALYEDHRKSEYGAWIAKCAVSLTA
jgi:hypothetical protein